MARYCWSSFEALSPRRLHDLLRLRNQVFIVEQACAYEDIDGYDPHCAHLCALDDTDQVLGALRLLPPGLKFAEASLGRLVVAPAHRGAGTARALILEGLEELGRRHPGVEVLIGGQRYLEAFYTELGFVTCSEPYLEDGIPHVDMRRAAPILAA
jgi:ElaA protein